MSQQGGGGRVTKVMMKPINLIFGMMKEVRLTCRAGAAAELAARPRGAARPTARRS